MFILLDTCMWASNVSLLSIMTQDHFLLLRLKFEFCLGPKYYLGHEIVVVGFFFSQGEFSCIFSH